MYVCLCARRVDDNRPGVADNVPTEIPHVDKTDKFIMQKVFVCVYAFVCVCVLKHLTLAISVLMLS